MPSDQPGADPIALPAPYVRAHRAVSAHPLLYIARCHHLSTRGLSMTFKAMPYLVEPYIIAPRQGMDVMSAAQTGKSELMVILAMHEAGWNGHGVVYILPSDRKKEEFVQTRINRLLLQTPAYRERLPRSGRGGEPQIGNLTVKRFGDGTLRFLGSNVESHFVEFSADVMIVDELDQCDERNLLLARDRLLEAPKAPRIYQVSNPRLPRTGIAAAFAAGDMRRWHHRCTRCGYAQHLDWFVHFVERTDEGWRLRDEERSEPDTGDPRPVCVKCHRPFERNGWRWVPERADAGRRSYHMTRLDILPRLQKPEPVRVMFSEWLLAQNDLAQMERFYWSILGLPYEAADAQVTVEDLAAACIEPPQQGEPQRPKGCDGAITMGVDVGARMHVVMSRLDRAPDGKRIRRAFWIGTLPTFDELEAVALRVKPSAFCIDAGPETHNAAGLVKRLRQAGILAYAVRYTETDKIGDKDYALTLDRKARVAKADRTQLLDTCLSELRHRPTHRTFPKNARSLEGFSDEMRASVRQYDERRERYIWTKGVDHYWHANAYDRVAADVYGRGGGYFSVDLSGG